MSLIRIFENFWNIFATTNLFQIEWNEKNNQFIQSSLNQIHFDRNDCLQNFANKYYYLLCSATTHDEDDDVDDGGDSNSTVTNSQNVVYPFVERSVAPMQICFLNSRVFLLFTQCARIFHTFIAGHNVCAMRMMQGSIYFHLLLLLVSAAIQGIESNAYSYKLFCKLLSRKFTAWKCSELKIPKHKMKWMSCKEQVVRLHVWRKNKWKKHTHTHRRRRTRRRVNGIFFSSPRYSLCLIHRSLRMFDGNLSGAKSHWAFENL